MIDVINVIKQTISVVTNQPKNAAEKKETDNVRSLYVLYEIMLNTCVTLIYFFIM